MTNCPKCGRKLHIYNWRQECPDCHVNIVYYKSNDRLLDETENAEIEHAEFQPKVDRAKSATIGQKKGIIRMILFLIPVAALFLPIFSITVYGNKTNYNIINLYKIISALDIGSILSDISVIFIAVALCLLPAVLGIVFTVLQVTAGKEKGLSRNIAFSCISLILSIASLICLIAFSESPADDYTKILLSKTEYVYENGNQSEVDAAVQQIRNVFNDKTVDTFILEKAIKNGNAALKDATNRGYDNKQKAEIYDKMKKAEKLFLKKDASIDDIRNAASAVNSAIAVYNDLETAVKYASLEKNNSRISAKSFKSLTDVTSEGRELLDILAKGGAIVDLKSNSSVKDKSAKDIKEETDAILLSKTAEINSSLASLVDVSVLAQLNDKLSESVKNGTASNAEVEESFGAGIIFLIVLIAAQLIFNIYIKKTGYEIQYTQCYIGGLPSEEYFSLVEQGTDLLEIRKKMVEALTEIQEKITAEEAEASEKKEAERAAWK